MVKPVKKSDSKPICQAVSYIKAQKQACNLERIARYMLREYEMDAIQVEKELKIATKAGILEAYMAISKKGNNPGMEQPAYRFPTATLEGKRTVEGNRTVEKKRKRGRPPAAALTKSKQMKPDVVKHDSDHDWYCFECQKTESLINCTECWRVWHSGCAEATSADADTFVCSACINSQSKCDLGRKYLNVLLGYAVHRLREKARELYHLPLKEAAFRWNECVYMPMDLHTMELKALSRKYVCPEEFLNDCKTIVHNVVLTYGRNEPMSLLAVSMHNDSVYDMDEIQQCHNCYYMSNLKPVDWFCNPCSPPHELVYAKQTGFSYWPAKIISKLQDDKFDVRFFGGYHQRAVVNRKFIKPISTNLKDLAVKKTTGFIKASGELEKHKQYLSGDRVNKYAYTEEDSDEDMDDDTLVLKEEPETQRVSSTSLAKSESIKLPQPEDGNLVTSTDNNIPTKKRMQSPDTRHISTQTKDVKCTTTITQTEKKLTDLLCDCGPGCHATTPASADISDEQLSPPKETVKDECDMDKAMAELRIKLQKDFEDDKQEAISNAVKNMQMELERTRKQTEEKCKDSHNEEIKKIQQKHKETVSAIKHKQWCYNCEAEAMYHCCWNTSYCSIKCQQEHWHKEHKRICRRKR